MKGLESAVICRDDEDYDLMVKYMALCSRRKNVLIVMYAAVSNHCHVAVLALSQKDADTFGEELKRMYSQWFSSKYGERKLLSKVDVKAITLDNDFHVRQAMAYIPRNALDNGCPVQEYPWSGFQAVFSEVKVFPESRRVAALSKREKGEIMHTRNCLKDVPWLLDRDNHLIPASFCDTAYLEQAFNHDPAYWLRMIGSVVTAEIQEKLVDGPRRMLPDSDFYKVVDDTARRWFSSEMGSLPSEKKYRLLPYIWRTRKTTVPQLARVFGLDRETVRQILKVP